MAMNFTPEQKQAIELQSGNILVSAAAGSGKTAVLVNRIIRMISDEQNPVDIDRLLVVTFTNAAAAEMRERIADAIAKKLSENPGSEHLQRQSTLLHNALITTIDSFSLFLIRNHFHEIGLDPAFRVADEGEIKLLKQDVIEELLEEAYASNGEEFHSCVEFFCPGSREHILEQHILGLSRYAASFPWPREWLLARKRDFDPPKGEEDACTEYLKKYVHLVLQEGREKLKEAVRVAEEPDGPYMYGELLEKEYEQFEKLCMCDSLEELAGKIPAVTFGRLPSKKDESVSLQKRELAKDLRSQVKELLKELASTFFSSTPGWIEKQEEACKGPVNTLIDLVLSFDEKMRTRKQEKKILDFSDMEHYALDILLKREGDGVVPTPVALEYRKYFHEILIDEYQDSNLVQEYLLKALSGEEEQKGNRFMVGDVKQSIYKFRLARPELFLEKYQSYKEQGPFCRIDLSKNFRSRTQVIDSVNDVFSRLMSEQTGGLLYDERAMLYAGASYPENEGCESELLFVETNDLEEEKNEKQAEAEAIAARIKKLKQDFLVTDKETGNLRPVKYSDMVILLRTNNGWDDVFKEVLEAEGIPVYTTSRTGYFGANEVQQLLQFLRIINNPRQDISLFCVLKSLFGGFSEEEIAQIVGQEKEKSLYEALCSAANKMTEEEKVPSLDGLSKKAAAFLEKLEFYRDLSVYLPIRKLLEKVVEDHDFLHYVTALPGGSKRRANVEMLFTKATDFEGTSYFGVFHFVRYMELLEKYDVDYGEADLVDENADVVRIFSIHKSKGLEFPVTFVAGLSKRFNMQDVNQSLVVDMNLGIGTDCIDSKNRTKSKTRRRSIIAKKMKEDNLSEELRVLYVAMTRAKEKLILSATLKDAAEKWEAAESRSKEKLSFGDFMDAGSYLDFLMPILGKTKIRVEILQKEDLAKEDFGEQMQLGEKEQLLLQAGKKVDEDALTALKERFLFQYPYDALSKLYTKTTVSELKIAAMSEKDEGAFHSFEERELEPYLPSFKREEKKVSGTQRGNAYHRVMELLDFAGLMKEVFVEMPLDDLTYQKELKIPLLKEKLKEQLLSLVAQKRLSEEEYQVIREEKLIHFLQTKLAFRMWRAQTLGRLKREQPFVLGISANRLQKDFPGEEKVLIQGIIDAYFEEEDGLVLLDYKTDVIESMDGLKRRYEVQLAYYSEALESLLRLPVKEKLLYSFHLEEYNKN